MFDLFCNIYIYIYCEFLCFILHTRHREPLTFVLVIWSFRSTALDCACGPGPSRQKSHFAKFLLVPRPKNQNRNHMEPTISTCQVPGHLSHSHARATRSCNTHQHQEELRMDFGRLHHTYVFLCMSNFCCLKKKCSFNETTFIFVFYWF